MTGLLWLVVLLPAVVGGALAMSRGLDRTAGAISVTTAGVGVVVSTVLALTRPAASVPFMAGTELGVAVDALSALVLPTVAAVTFLVLVFAASDIEESRPRFHGLMLLFASAVNLTVTATTLPALLLAWEVMGATSYALIGFWWRDQHRVSAGLTAFVTTRTADLGLYVAAGAALAGGAGLALADLPEASAGWRHVIALGILVAALGKAAQLPFSFWLSRAMEGPSPVSALLHSAAMVAMGGYLLLRVASLLDVTGWAGPVAAWTGAATAVLLGLVAVAQRDLKQLLAASTAAQLGFVVMGAGLAAVTAGATHLVAHAATKATLFLAAGAWLALLGSKQLSDLRGVARQWPVVGVAAGLAALALAGVAPLSLWATKDAVLSVALEESVALYAVGLLASALSAAYAAKVLLVIWRGAAPDGRPVPALQQVPLVVLAGGAATLGLIALPPLGTALARAQGETLHVAPVELAVSAALAAAVIGLAVRWRLPEPRWAAAWLGLELATQSLVVRPTLHLAEALARFDDRVLDRAVTSSAGSFIGLARGAAGFDDNVLDGGVASAARASLAAADRAARTDQRWLDGAVEGLARQVRRLGRVARLPQTGQLHQYYIQAVAMLAVGVVVLVAVR